MCLCDVIFIPFDRFHFYIQPTGKNAMNSYIFSHLIVFKAYIFCNKALSWITFIIYVQPFVGYFENYWNYPNCWSTEITRSDIGSGFTEQIIKKCRVIRSNKLFIIYCLNGGWLVLLLTLLAWGVCAIRSSVIVMWKYQAIRPFYPLKAHSVVLRLIALLKKGVIW